MTRKEARAEVLGLVFEAAFKTDEEAQAIFDRAVETRGIEKDDYIRETFFGVEEQLSFIDGRIEKYSNGWKTSRISPVSLAIMRVAVYEMYFRDDVPDRVALNEALELVKVYDDADKVKGFINGILNSVMKEKEAGQQ